METTEVKRKKTLDGGKAALRAAAAKRARARKASEKAKASKASSEKGKAGSKGKKGKGKKGKKGHNEEDEEAVDERVAAAARVGMVGASGDRLPVPEESVGKALVKLDGTDVSFKGKSRKSMFLFALPAHLARTGAGTALHGSLSDLNTLHPKLSIPMDDAEGNSGALLLQGSIVRSSDARFLLLQGTSSGVSTSHVYDSIVLFSAASWVPDKDPSSLVPLTQIAGKDAEWSHVTGYVEGNTANQKIGVGEGESDGEAPSFPVVNLEHKSHPLITKPKATKPKAATSRKNSTSVSKPRASRGGNDGVVDDDDDDDAFIMSISSGGDDDDESSWGG